MSDYSSLEHDYLQREVYSLQAEVYKLQTENKQLKICREYKVGYSDRWKTRCDELEKENKHLQRKCDSLWEQIPEDIKDGIYLI